MVDDNVPEQVGEEDIWSDLVDKYPHLFLSDAEKQILELSGYTFYERFEILRQFLELYLLDLQYFVEDGRILDFVYIYQPNHFGPAAGKI